MVTLIKNGKRQDFSERAAKIAVEHLGWSEFFPVETPKEIFTKTRPPEIIKPIKLIDPEIVKPETTYVDKMSDNESEVVPKAVIEPVQITELVKVVKKRRTRKAK